MSIRRTSVNIDDLGGDDGTEGAILGGSIISPTVAYPVQNLNVGYNPTAGTASVGNGAATQHASPTLVQLTNSKNNHWFFILLVVALVYFEMKKGNL